MTMPLQPGEPLIDDDTPNDVLFRPVINGELKGRGLVPRNYAEYPRDYLASPSEIQIIPRSEWSARIKEQEERKSRLSDILLAAGIPSMDQGSNGYCWGHSVVGCVQAVRAINNQPYVPLSAYMVCAIIKRGANEGGWCGLAGKFVREVGVCSQALWPQGNRNLSLDTPEARANASLHKTNEDWVDVAAQVYDQNMIFDAVMSLLMVCTPTSGDFNHWSHSVLLCDAVEVEANSFGIRFRNSWTDSYGDRGFGVLRGSKAVTDGAIAIRSTGVSPV